MKNKERLEEVAKEVFKGEYICNGIDIVPAWREGFVTGAKWQQEQYKKLYSEEDLHNAFYNGWIYRGENYTFPKAKKEWFEQFKKK